VKTLKEAGVSADKAAEVSRDFLVPAFEDTGDDDEDYGDEEE
jgi:hypothetical protein